MTVSNAGVSLVVAGLSQDLTCSSHYTSEGLGRASLVLGYNNPDQK
jgi:hypothetical protein